MSSVLENEHYNKDLMTFTAPGLFMVAFSCLSFSANATKTNVTASRPVLSL